MCCIIHRPKDTDKISQENLEKIIKINPDGWGVSFVSNNGKFRTVRSLNMSDAIGYLRKLEKDNVEFVFHARYATHGLKIQENCHPYDIYNGALFHNGKIAIKCPNKRYSDTYYFSLKVNKALRRGRTADSIVKYFKASIGESRLAFMNRKGVITKFGTWHTIDGIHYSKINWQNKWAEDEFDYYNMGGWGKTYPSSGVTKSAKRSMASFFPNTAQFQQDAETAFKEIMMSARFDGQLFTYQLDPLCESQLNSVAKKFPDLCAKYLLERASSNIPF